MKNRINTKNPTGFDDIVKEVAKSIHKTLMTA
jgi:hypothetical protein